MLRTLLVAAGFGVVATVATAATDVAYASLAHKKGLPPKILKNLAHSNDAFSDFTAQNLDHYLRPMTFADTSADYFYSPVSRSGNKENNELPHVMSRVAQLLSSHSVHMTASNDNTTISGRRITFDDGSVAFDQQQLWFNVSFTGPATLYVTLEVMCLQGGQTPNIFRAFTVDGANPNSEPEVAIIDTVDLQQSNGTNKGPYCNTPITFPVASTFTATQPTNFSLFKDTEPNYNSVGENWVILYGFSLVSVPEKSQQTGSANEQNNDIPRLRAQKKKRQQVTPAFLPALWSPTHLQSLAQKKMSQLEFAKSLQKKGLVQEKSSALPRRRRIEWLGDSVTVGYGTLCHLQNVTNVGYTTESGWFAWPNPTCAFFGAECHVEGWSGKGLIRNCCNSPPPAMNEYYLRTIATSARSDWAWNFSSWVPDAVVMRLGTNDFSNTDDGPAFMKNYTDAVVQFFVDTFNHYGPQVQVFVACGPSRTDYCQGLSDAMAIVRQPNFAVKAAVTNTHFIDLRQIYHSDNSNVCAGHPDTNAAYVLATRAIGAISAVMNWNEWDV